jgi:hypothetical protein
MSVATATNSITASIICRAFSHAFGQGGGSWILTFCLLTRMILYPLKDRLNNNNISEHDAMARTEDSGLTSFASRNMEDKELGANKASGITGLHWAHFGMSSSLGRAARGGGSDSVISRLFFT